MPFSLSQDQYDRLLHRVSRLEESHNNFVVAIQKLVSMTQVNELVVTLESSIQVITEQVESLDERVISIEETPV